jgi:hypothetical protein
MSRLILSCYKLFESARRIPSQGYKLNVEISGPLDVTSYKKTVSTLGNTWEILVQ